jgi:tetratricopeptide (TPR) repeat protein
VEATVPLVAPEVPPAPAPGESAAAGQEEGRRPRRWAAWVGGALGLLVVAAAALLLILRPRAQEPGQQQAQQTEKPTPQKQEKPPFPFRMSEAYPRAGEPLTLEQAQRAVNELKPHLEQEPKNAMLRLQLGNAFYDLQEWERAAVAYKDALALDPNMAIAHYNLGNTLVYLARPKEAIPHYKKVIDLRLDAAEGAIFNMGFAQAIVGNYPEAIAALERFKEIHRQEDIWRERAGGMLEWLRKQP